jgi:hypothetical protein
MPKRTWRTEIVESTRIVEGLALDLSDALDRLHADGWTVLSVLTNGINRWTVIAWKDEG